MINIKSMLFVVQYVDFQVIFMCKTLLTTQKLPYLMRSSSFIYLFVIILKSWSISYTFSFFLRPHGIFLFHLCISLNWLNFCKYWWSVRKCSSSLKISQKTFSESSQGRISKIVQLVNYRNAKFQFNLFEGTVSMDCLTKKNIHCQTFN